MGRYLDLARRALEASAAASPDEINERSEIRSAQADFIYRERARSTLVQISRPDYPAGLIPWLGERHPPLYDELTGRLPDEIHRLWVERAPLGEFDRILGLWVEAHRTASELYRKAHVPEQSALGLAGVVK